MRLRTATVTIVCFCLCLGIAGVGVAGATGGSDENGTAGGAPGVEIDPAIADADGETTVIVRLADRPEHEVMATTSENQVSSMRAHAADTQTAFERFAEGNPHVEIRRQFWLTNAIVVTVDADKVPIERLGMVDHVTGVHENFEMEAFEGAAASASPPAIEPTGTPSVTRALSSSDTTYGLEKIRAPETWETFGNRGDGVRVAVLDTGIDADHVDLELTAGGWAEFDEDGNRVDSAPHDSGYHGTHVSGTVAGGNAGGQWIGVAPDAELMHGMVLNGSTGTFAQVTAGMEWAVANDADVISMSLGGPKRTDDFIEHVRNAEQAGTIVVAASGNAGEGTSGSPGDVYEAFAIGATDENDNVTDFSSGEQVFKSEWSNPPDEWPTSYTVPDISAPGMEVLSAIPNNQWAPLNGTSMATPHASGAIALLLSNTDEELTPDEIRDLFESTAVDVGEQQHRQGAGRIDVYEAVLTHSRNTLDPTFAPGTATVSEPTTITIDADHPIEEYEWTFEDGTSVTTTAPEVKHTFEELGPTTVAVTMKDSSGQTSASTEIDVVDTIAPTAVLDVPDRAISGTNATFDATGSTDNHEIVRYEWAFGDGTRENTTDPIATHAFGEAGEYAANLTVVDRAGRANSTEATLTVRNPPSVSIDAPADGTATAESNVTIEYTLADTDVENASALEYRVEDVGAGGNPVVDWTGGPFERNESRQSFSIHTGNLTDGNYTVRLRLLDGNGDVLPYDSATDAIDVWVKTAEPTLELGVRHRDERYSVIGEANPAIVNVTVTDPRHESTTVAIANGTDEIASWNLSADTGAGETATIEWNATDENGDPVDGGEYELTATAVDDLGNENISSAPLTVDTDAPIVRISSIAGGDERDGVVYVNETTDLTIGVEAEDYRTDAKSVSVENVSVVVEATATTYRHEAAVEKAADLNWTATVDGGALPDGGTYRVRAIAIDAAKNANDTTAVPEIEYDRTAPRLSAVVTEFDDAAGDATVEIRSDEPLAGAPNLSVTGPDGNETRVDDPSGVEGTNTRWTWTFEAGGGRYELTAVGTDYAGNRGADASTATIRPAIATENRSVTVAGDAAFVTVTTTADVDGSSLVLSETAVEPHRLGPERQGVAFLTTALGPELDGAVSNATVGFAANESALPGNVTVDDDRVRVQQYNGSRQRWDDRTLTIETVSADDGDRTEGEYWTATVDDTAAVGVTVLDDRPPELVDVTPIDGAGLPHDAESVPIELTYEDDVSGVNVSSIDLRIDGESVTDSERTSITSRSARFDALAVEPGESYAITLELADVAGNPTTVESEFEVASDDGEDGDDDDAGGGGGISLAPPSGGDSDGSELTAAISVDPDPASIGEDVTFSGAGSAGDRTIVGYEWTIAGESAAGETVTASFDAAGTYDVELTVRNDVGESDTATATVTVEDDSERSSGTDGSAADEDDRESDGSTEQHETATEGGADSIDDIPGFGALVALATVLSFGARATRRRR